MKRALRKHAICPVLKIATTWSMQLRQQTHFSTFYISGMTDHRDTLLAHLEITSEGVNADLAGRRGLSCNFSKASPTALTGFTRRIIHNNYNNSPAF